MDGELTKETITFGKYKDMHLSIVLKDRQYCRWLTEQEWFKEQYEYLYNCIVSYNPTKYFFKEIQEGSIDFMERYQYFNLVPVEDLRITLTEKEEICYGYYLLTLENLKERIENRLEKKEKNIYNIKAPVRWLKVFEQKYSLNRDLFKEFLSSYELKNITKIVEDIKKEGGIDYKGDRGFKIAKENSLRQECHWNNILKKHYGDNISSQFKFGKCIFDFLDIGSNTIYECKLGLKDFDLKQYKKYLVTLNNYRIIYLIHFDCIVSIKEGTIYTTDKEKYSVYLSKLDDTKCNTFELLLKKFEIKHVNNIESALITI